MEFNLNNAKLIKLIIPPIPVFLNIEWRDVKLGDIHKCENGYTFFSLIFIRDGKMHYEDEYCNCELQKGDFLFIYPTKRWTSQYSKDGNCSYVCINFDFEGECGITQNSDYELTFSNGKYLPNIPFLIPRSGTTTVKDFDEILSSMYLSYLMKTNYLDCQISLLRLLQKLSYLKSSKGDELTARVLFYIKKNFTNIATTKQVSRFFGYSPDHISKIFKKTYGFTIKECIVNFKLEYATRLLEETNLSMAEISEETGFSSSSNFIRQFKQKIGKTPYEYKHTELI